MFCTMIFNEMVLKVTSVGFNQGSRALWVTWNKGFVTGVRTYTTLGETEEVNVQKGMDGWAEPLTRALQREVVNKGVEGHCLCLWPGLEHVSRAGGQEESWMQNGRGQGQSRSHGSKVESTGTNCHVHLPLTAWNPKPAVPPRREGSALDAELHVCPAQDSESQQELEKLWTHWLPHTQVRQWWATMHDLPRIRCPAPTCPAKELQLHPWPPDLIEIALWPTLCSSFSEKCNFSSSKLT